MAVSRARKTEQVEILSKELKNISNLIVTTYSKLTVDKDFELRKTLRNSGAKYLVVKNTLAELAAKGTKVEAALTNLSGVTSIAYTEGDPVALAKALSKYAKDNPEFTFKAGVVEGRVVTLKEISALATMPSKEELYSKLLFLINAPAQRLEKIWRWSSIRAWRRTSSRATHRRKPKRSSAKFREGASRPKKI
jgi:large subunit ribosomal protein L10